MTMTSTADTNKKHENGMKAEKTNDFIKQLQACKKSFLKRASNYGKMDNDTFEIGICNCYFNMRIEGEDEYGDTIVCEQEFELNDDAIYQGSILPLNFFVN